jgi:hypothetical protein
MDSWQIGPLHHNLLYPNIIAKRKFIINKKNDIIDYFTTISYEI